nr:rod shape-determining protein MreD [Bacillus licheniformis]
MYICLVLPVFAIYRQKRSKYCRQTRWSSFLFRPLAVCVLEFYQYGVQMLIRPEIMPFHQFVLGRLLPTLALNAVGGLLLIYPFKWFFTSLKKELRNE